jgi:hypothetical protein|eukprot:COSAG01_NODE_4136_length_5308_cov_65.001728_6_plen_110_part_00
MDKLHRLRTCFLAAPEACGRAARVYVLSAGNLLKQTLRTIQAGSEALASPPAPGPLGLQQALSSLFEPHLPPGVIVEFSVCVVCTLTSACFGWTLSHWLARAETQFAGC